MIRPYDIHHMLLIGDIHLHAKYSQDILSSIESFITQHPDEKNIIFVGDYVYHFSYHRKSLLQLFALFVELSGQGKHVYVLAWNHDWLSEHFVFAEGQYIAEIFEQRRKEKNNNEGSLHFITKPRLTQIEGQKVYFLPFLLNTKDIEVQEENRIDNEALALIYESGKLLTGSKDKYEQFSGMLNMHTCNVVDQILKDNPGETVTLIHHYYIANTEFPGQKGRFHFKDIALDPALCKVSWLQLISGHIHQGFAFNNYLCLGSMRPTSPLEFNQCKYLRQRNTASNQLTAHEVQIYPYMRIELEKDANPITDKDIQTKRTDIVQTNQQNYLNNHRNISFIQQKNLDLTKTSLHLVVASIDYEKLENFVDEALESSFKQVKLHKKRNSVSNLLAQLETSNKDFSGGWHDWKAILQEYLEKKYPDDIEQYTKELQALGLM